MSQPTNAPMTTQQSKDEIVRFFTLQQFTRTMPKHGKYDYISN